jgi:hypothetical protein
VEVSLVNGIRKIVVKVKSDVTPATLYESVYSDNPTTVTYRQVINDEGITF